MKKLYFLVAALLVIGLGCLFRTQLLAIAAPVVYYSPCDTPIPYSIGSIDSRFNVTKEELLVDAKSAANVWNTTQNKQLFVYDPESKFTINMVYDDRQALTSKITEMNSNLKQQQGEIDPKITAFKKKQVDFEKRVSALNQEIQYWNGKGGAPQEEYDKLTQQQKALQAEAADLNATARELGQSTDEYNANAQVLNKTIGDYQDILQYKPEEGLYEQEGRNRKISIYIDISQDEFLHTLTHEMGHALGLDHNSDPTSIMYPQTTNVLTPSSEDSKSLNTICEKKLITEVAVARMREIILIVSERLGKK
jgi:peptidoglycan hydrolase CwlO-like protein